MALIEPGQMLGKYQIVQQIGVGGMSEIFEALDTTLERSVALKVLPPEFSTDSEHVQRFRKEVLAVAALDHPGIVTIFDVGSADDLQFYAMTLLPEGNLKTRMGGQALPPPEALAITRALASALQHAHDQSIIHRDIKPENVLFGKDGAPVLVDFGIVKVLNSASQLTQVGTSVGTPYYMSPEQAQSSSNVDARSDFYSLGVMLHEMLTGVVPFDAATSVGIALQHVNQPVPTLPSELSVLQPLLNSLMAKQQDARPSSGQELAEQIDALAAAVRDLPALSQVQDDSSGQEEDAAPTAAESDSAAGSGEEPDSQAVDHDDQAQTQQSEKLDTPPPPNKAPRAVDPATEFELMSVTPARNPVPDPDPEVKPPAKAEPPHKPEPRSAPSAQASAKDTDSEDLPKPRSEGGQPGEGAGSGPETELQLTVPTEKGQATADAAAESDPKPVDKPAQSPAARSQSRVDSKSTRDEADPTTSAVMKSVRRSVAEAARGSAGQADSRRSSAKDQRKPSTPAAKPDKPASAPKPAEPEKAPSHLMQTTLIPAVKPPSSAARKPPEAAPPEVDSAPEAERWRVDDLYQKPPPQWHRKPAVWGAAAAVAAALILAVLLAGRGSEEASPLELVTGEGNEPGIGLGNQARQREPEQELAAAEDPPAQDARPTDDSAAAQPEENLDALLAEMLVDSADMEEADARAASAAAVEPASAATDKPDIQAPARANPKATTPTPEPPPAAQRTAATPPPATQPVTQTNESRPASTSASPEVAQLLLDAELLIAADQLTLPTGENAWEAYQQVLDLDPSNREALRGLARLQRTYVNRINAALADNDVEAAGRLTERLRFIDPLHPDLAQFDASLNRVASNPAPFQDSLSDGGNGPLMIPLPAATVTLGDPQDDSSGTSVTVSLPAFALGAYEVTVGEFRQFASATGLPAPASADEGCNYWLFNWRQRADKFWDSPGFNQSESHPAVCISYDDALAYTSWLSEQTGFSYALPSEYQWEYAAAMDAQAGVYWTSNRDACDLANVSDLDRAERHNLEISSQNIFGCRDRRVNTAPVGSFQATQAGFYDLLGNVGEWTSDCWREDYSARGSQTGCVASTIRGGSWFEKPIEVSVHHRLRLERTARFSHIGFRVMREQ